MTYPGSEQPLREPQQQMLAEPVAPPVDHSAWDANPVRLIRRGEEVCFYTISALAKVLDRSAGTIREWETTSTLPRTSFRTPANHARGMRRLYSREQIEGLREIAESEGVLERAPSGRFKRAIGDTNFTPRAFDLFKRLRGAR